MFKRLSRKEIYKDAWVTLYRDEIAFPDGSEGTYSVVDRKNGVGIVVITTDEKILLNKEYRYVIDQYDWEIPGGGIDDGETPEIAAIRELHEETGIKVDEVKKLGMFYPLHSFNTEQVHLFFCVIPEKSVTTRESEHSEHVSEQRYFTFKEALEMIDRGEIIDAMTAHAIQMAIRKYQNK